MNGISQIGQEVISQNETAWLYYGYDGLGSVRQTTDADGILRYGVNYDPYGNPIEQIVNPVGFGYTGAQTDDNGLVYLHNRYYDPRTGAFLSKDPVHGIVGGASVRWNPYSYVGGNPINHVDPTGMCFACIAVGAIVLSATAFAGIEAYQQHQQYGYINNPGKIAGAAWDGGVFATGAIALGAVAFAFPQATLYYAGATLGYIGVREGLDAWDNNMLASNGFGKSALGFTKGALDIGGIFTGMYFIREDIHRIADPTTSWHERLGRVGDIGVNTALGIPMFEGLRFALRSGGLSRRLAAETTEAGRLSVLQDRIPVIFGLDPSDIRIESRVMKDLGRRSGNTISLNSKLLGGNAQRLADVALHEGMHLRHAIVGNRSAQGLVRLAEYLTPPRRVHLKAPFYLSTPAEIAARSSAWHYLVDNLAVDIAGRAITTVGRKANEVTSGFGSTIMRLLWERSKK